MIVTKSIPTHRFAAASSPSHVTRVTLEHLPEAVRVEFAGDRMAVHLADGREVRVPLSWFPTLLAASPAQRGTYEMVCNGIGLHWPELDLDVFVLDLLAPQSIPPLPR